jgi:hypothetical protein
LQKHSRLLQEEYLAKWKHILYTHSHWWVPLASILQWCCMICVWKFRGQTEKWDKDAKSTMFINKTKTQNTVQGAFVNL